MHSQVRIRRGHTTPIEESGAVATQMIVTEIELIHSTEGEKGQQIENVAGYQGNRNGYTGEGLKGLQATARERRNVFVSLMEAVKMHGLGQISHALYDVGDEYRRDM
jgi:methylmalonyl-CoA mutase